MRIQTCMVTSPTLPITRGGKRAAKNRPSRLLLLDGVKQSTVPDIDAILEADVETDHDQKADGKGQASLSLFRCQ